MQLSGPARRPIGHSALWLLCVLVGIVAGLGAVAFRGLIALFHNLFFLGRFSFVYDANQHTATVLPGAWVIVVPVIGAAGVAFLIKRFAPEAKGHGVPEVIDAIYYEKGFIRPVVALVKSVASALSIGSGGSVGREGPIIQIGASFGSAVGQLLRVPARQRITIIAAGAGAGIAATFNTPIGGVLFAAELLLPEVSVWTLVPVVISTAMATYMGRLFLGTNPSFVIPEFESPFFHPTNPFVLLAYVGLGFLMGAVSAAFIRSIYAFEDFFEKRIPGNDYTRHMLGMLGVGLLIWWTQQSWGHYYVDGVGYATVQDVLSGALSSLEVLLILFVLKIVATSLTLGSGGSGGIFSPCLFLGATFGGAYGTVLDRLFPMLPISPPAFAVVGMAGVVGGATGAAITAIVMIFEMTLDYRVILPMTITVAISYGVRKFLSSESIYSLKLARRGHRMPEALQANFPLVRLATDIMEKRIAILPAATPLTELAARFPGPDGVQYLLAEEAGTLAGVVRIDAALWTLVKHGGGVLLREIASPDFAVAPETATVFELISRMRSGATELLVITAGPGPASADAVKGIVSKQRIADAVTETFGLAPE